MDVVLMDCGHENPPSARFCETCGVEVMGSAAQQRIAHEAEAEFLLSEAQRARTFLLLVAVANSIGSFLVIANTAPDERAGVGAIMGLVVAMFWGIWGVAARYPFGAAVAGLAIYLSLWVVNIIFDPSQVFAGIFFKIIIIFGLAKGVKAGLEHRRFVRSRRLD